MAVENDYNLLVANLGFLAENITGLRDEVEKRLVVEKRDGLEPNATHWVNLMFQQLVVIDPHAHHLREGAQNVLQSRPGEPVFTAQPPAAPDAPP